MSFTEWIFLLGGLAVVGPVIAHLLAKPRYRRLPFTMLRFLHSGQFESRSRRKLRDLLILLLRCAIIVLIAMLFARPLLYTRLKPSETNPVHCLGLDNSMSMAYSDNNGSYFEKLKDSAVDYISEAENDALFSICALASGDWMQGLSKEQALFEVKALKVEPANANIGDFISGLSRISQIEHNNDEISVLVLSDFTPNTFRQFVNVAEPVDVERFDYESVVSSQPVSNAAIVDAHVVSVVEGKLKINAAVVNYGQVEQNRRLTARTEASQSAPLDVSLSANQRKNYHLSIDVGTAGREPSCLPVELNLSEDDGLGADDTFYLAVTIPERKDVNVLLAGESEYKLFLLKTALDTLARTNSYETFRIKQVLMDDLDSSKLEWTDVVISSTITDHLRRLSSQIGTFLESGGRFICFLSETIALETAKQLWQQDVLAALPGKYLQERTIIQPKPQNHSAFGLDQIAERSLANYRIDKILMKGCYECRQHPDAQSIWQFRNGIGFIYLECRGNGTSILVNTSADDSLGSLTKSSASVAFCRYLLGEGNQVEEHCFTRDEHIMLPISERELSDPEHKQIWFQTCDGKNHQAPVVESSLFVSNPAGIGWVKTLGKPTIYAGVNLPHGETDMTKPVASELANVMDRVFETSSERIVSEAEVLHDKKLRPIWRIFAWTIILLLLAEPAITNRLKR